MRSCQFTKLVLAWILQQRGLATESDLLAAFPELRSNAASRAAILGLLRQHDLISVYPDARMVISPRGTRFLEWLQLQVPIPANTTGTVTSGAIPKNGGFGLIVYGGGTAAQLVTAAGLDPRTCAFWGTVGGNFVTYVPGTRVSIVNESFFSVFPGGFIPANTPFIGKAK